MSTSENPRVKELRGVRDPLERARLCQLFLDNGRLTLEAVQGVRDAAIREARASGTGGTRQEIADAIGAGVTVVVGALRAKCH